MHYVWHNTPALPEPKPLYPRDMSSGGCTSGGNGET